ncbi:IS3 family transposase [Leuconostocaceae bacterium ESL0958]|nr:IS3 family transposase [Leuconostocaceae bacterium ESL0958]
MTQFMSWMEKAVNNGLIENFFGTLKREKFHGLWRSFSSIAKLTQAVSAYKIKSKLKERTPMAHRSFVLKQAQ